jgi:hypothetical protein
MGAVSLPKVIAHFLNIPFSLAVKTMKTWGGQVVAAP